MDMMLLCEEARRHATQSLDISHIMWVELGFVVYNRKVPICGPYLHLLILKMWEKLYPEGDFSAPNLVRHEPIKLRQKNKWANTTTRVEAEAARKNVDEDEVEEEEEDEDSSAGYAPPSTKLSWAKKLKEKMKTLFCMQAKGQYRTHVASKESRQRDKRILRMFGEIVESRSEKNITPKADWIPSRAISGPS